jgi:DNA-binding response OmpR family regulator
MVHEAVTDGTARSDSLAPMTITHDGEVLRAGELEIRPGEHRVLAAGRTLPLSLRELDLLAALARREGRIVGRDELYESVWGSELRRDDRSVDVYVHKLRTKLGEALPGRSFIHTHFGFGYRFEPEPSALFTTGPQVRNTLVGGGCEPRRASQPPRRELTR